MIVVLDTDVIRVVAPASNAGSLQCVASWRDIGATAYTPGRTVVAAAAGATTTIVPSPVSRTRVVDQLQIHNPTGRHASLRVEFYDGADAYVLWNGRIGPGGRLHYSDAAGFVLRTQGDVQERAVSWSVPRDQWQTLFLEREISFTISGEGAATNSFRGVPELGFVVPAGRPVLIEFCANIETPNTTVAITAGLGFPVTIALNDGRALVFAAGGKRQANGLASLSIGYTLTPSPAQIGTDAAIAADRTGGNMVMGAMVGLNLYTETAVQFFFGGENTAAQTVKLKPGTMVAYAFGPEISP